MGNHFRTTKMPTLQWWNTDYLTEHHNTYFTSERKWRPSNLWKTTTE